MNGYQQMQFQDYEYHKIQGYESNKLQPVNSKDYTIFFKEFSDLKESFQFKSSTISNWISTIQYFKKDYISFYKIIRLQGSVNIPMYSNIVQNTVL